MLKLNIGDKELKIKFGYKPTLKERIISKMTKLSKATKKDEGEETEKETETTKNENDGADLEKIEDLLMFLPEILLVGLQVHHEEYRYDYDTKEGKQEQLDRAFNLVDEYATDGGDLIELFNRLQEEIQNDSFLSSLFRKAEAAEQTEEAVQSTAEETKSKNKEN